MFLASSKKIHIWHFGSSHNVESLKKKKKTKVGDPIINYILFLLLFFIHKIQVLENGLRKKWEKNFQTAAIFFNSTLGDFPINTRHATPCSTLNKLFLR